MLVIKGLIQLISKNASSRINIKATLFQIYHLSLHNNYFEAKTILLKSNLAEVISSYDYFIQILYNRCVAQIGLAAFRLGYVEEAHDVLLEIYNSGKVRDLIGQGASRYQDRADIEKDELKRQVPFHMHINSMLLDSAHLITAMLVEIPQLSTVNYQNHRKVLNKNFRKMIDSYDSRPFHIAPETYKDYIVNAAHSLSRADWKNAFDTVLQIPQIRKLPEIEEGPLKDVLLQKFKQTALITFLLKGNKNYETLSVESLSSFFELESGQVKRMMSKLIVRKDLHGHFEDSTKCLKIDQESKGRSEVHELLIEFATKVQDSVDHNERTLDYIGDGTIYGFKDKQGDLKGKSKTQKTIK